MKEKIIDESQTVSPERRRRRSYKAELFVIAFLLLYAPLAFMAHQYAYFNWDLSAARLIQSWSFPGFNSIMLAISALGTGWVPFALSGVVGVLLLVLNLKQESLVLIAGTATAAIANRLLKIVIARPRPSQPLIEVLIEYPNESFPSGHVVFFCCFFGFLFFLALILPKRGLPRSSGLLTFGALVLLVGVSRVYVGAHWPSDIMGAYLLGGVWLVLMMHFYRSRKTLNSEA